MNGVTASLAEALHIAARGSEARAAGIDLILCPPATLLAAMATTLQGQGVLIGGQDCHPAASGAHTGDIAASMLKDCGASCVILGHSERRADHGETSALVAQKVQAAASVGLVAIVCVGETEAQRDAGMAEEIVLDQLRASLPDGIAAESVLIAYEPVWAIGTGRIPSSGDVAAMHSAIRTALRARFGDAGQGVSILYGGSVKPDNARELMSIGDVDGALVGGASLKAATFLPILDALMAV